MEYFINQIAKEGGAYLFLALSLLVNVLLFRTLVKSYEDRIKDLNETVDSMISPIENVKNMVALVLQSLKERA